MRFLFIFMSACYILAPGVGRPQDAQENFDSVAEYENEGNDPDDNESENEASISNAQVKRHTFSRDMEAADTDPEVDESQPEDDQAIEEPTGLNTNYDEPSANRKFPDYKSSAKIRMQDDKNGSAIDTVEYEAKQREPSKIEGGEVAQSMELQAAQREYEGNYIESRPLESRNADTEGHFLFNNIQNVADRADEQGYDGEAPDSNERAQYAQQHRNTKQAENPGRGKRRKFQRFHLNRDRRNANKEQKDNNNIANVSPDNKDLDSMSPRDEEAAIKRHVKKLSSDELQELLTSLSEEKRKLLQKIMASEYEDAGILDKREITKKAGSLQDNSNIDCGLSDLTKFQGSSTARSTDKSQSTPTAKVPETSDFNSLSTTSPDLPKGTSVPKTDTESGGQVNIVADTSLNSDSSLNNNQASNIPTSDTNTKTEIKREANSQNISISDTESIENNLVTKDSQDSDIQGNTPCQDEDLSELIQDQSSSHEENSIFSKREASEKESDYRDLIRSLEESFPKLDSYDEPKQYYGSDVAPLIRVKRKNVHPAAHFAKKRQAALLPEAKVAYFSFRAGHDDEDEESNEFDDNSFDDRNSNLAGSGEHGFSSNAETGAGPSQSNADSESQNDYSSEVSENENIESDTSLGSDTDGVLSGVEGVDDNSMLVYSNSGRNRRGFENKPQLIEEENKSVTENYVSASNFPVGSDVFGALHKNYVSSVGRHKRVRHVKHRTN